MQAHLQHYSEPSAEPIPATSTLSSTTLLPLGLGTLTHNSAGVPIIVACTKADLIDDGNDVIGAGTSGMGGMVKGKGGEWEERTDGIMQVLRAICMKCTSLRSYILQPSIDRFCRWCCTILHNTYAPNAASLPSICVAPTVCTPSTLSRLI